MPNRATAGNKLPENSRTSSRTQNEDTNSKKGQLNKGQGESETIYS